MNELDKIEVTIDCPTCGKKIKKTIGWFKRQNNACPFGCGTAFDTKEFRRTIQDLERELRKFGK